jgi:catechol-2,3-dioxygenase
MENEKITSEGMDYSARFVVKDLERQIQFYTDTVGLQLQWRNDYEAGLGGCNVNMLLLTKKNDKPADKSISLKLPGRRHLAIVIGRLCTIQYSTDKIDHGNRHSAHLIDPEGNQVEIFAEADPNAPEISKPLDIEALFNELDPDDRLCDKMPAEKTTVKTIKAQH